MNVLLILAMFVAVGLLGKVCGEMSAKRSASIVKKNFDEMYKSILEKSVDNIPKE